MARLRAMPRFYFHICNGTGFLEDREGAILSDEATARAHALEAARDVMAGDLRAGELDLTSFIEVEDETRTLVCTINFSEAVTIKARHAANENQAPSD